MKYCPLRAKAKRIFISIFCLISLQFTRTMNIITHYGSSTSWNSNEHAINCSISFIWCKNDVFWVMQKSSQKRNFNRTHFTNNTTQYIYKDIINNTWMISCVCCVIVDFCTCLIVCFLISFLFRKGRSYINLQLQILVIQAESAKPRRLRHAAMPNSKPTEGSAWSAS